MESQPLKNLGLDFSPTRYDFSVYLATSFKDDEKRYVFHFSMPLFAFNSFSTNVGFINFTFPLDWRLLFIKLGDSFFGEIKYRLMVFLFKPVKEVIVLAFQAQIEYLTFVSLLLEKF
jgi:hypothetical protein